MKLYQVGAMDFSAVEKVYDQLKKKIRDEAAAGAKPAAAKGARSAVMPVVVGVGAVSLLSLIIALRK